MSEKKQISKPCRSAIFYLLKKRPVVSGENLTNAQPSFDENGLPAVSFNFNPSAALKFGNYTKNYKAGF